MARLRACPPYHARVQLRCQSIPHEIGRSEHTDAKRIKNPTGIGGSKRVIGIEPTTFSLGSCNSSDNPTPLRACNRGFSFQTRFSSRRSKNPPGGTNQGGSGGTRAQLPGADDLADRAPAREAARGPGARAGPARALAELACSEHRCRRERGRSPWSRRRDQGCGPLPLGVIRRDQGARAAARHHREMRCERGDIGREEDRSIPAAGRNQR